ncbi:NLR family CARD domain-containing protein 3-like [Periophthalmus magnuspinnatus]|uniref:NLR family CARD domain-containing protein 3-like n=1 Tax=Periophthalmus magnuspinnatus TaxID=409849 RepID=UPI002436A80A|nr:NLR family CARD domain-containing protein 3-like [Periophthalmus magnuspinnatus]XP_055078268.1 NLR family CARD domain-containing protein 3-like [Periophthalmus magnuspinnatus]XP_055078269.1 NLR family CARD domain-containing protein 3-like [Periophthalmus magnuspinnatus]
MEQDTEETDNSQLPKSEIKKRESSCVSCSDESMYLPMTFQKVQAKPLEKHGNPDCMSVKSNESMNAPITFKNEDNKSESLVADKEPNLCDDVDSVFIALENSIMDLVKTELKKIKNIARCDSPECLGNLKEEDENSKAFLKIALNLLKQLKQEKLADHLQKVYAATPAEICQRKLKSKLQQRFECVFEGIAKAGNRTLLNQIYTELYITEGEVTDVNKEHEIRQIEAGLRRSNVQEKTITCEDIFKGLIDRDEPIRTVLTKGVAGIGKTVLTQKFSLDWAEGKANQDIEFMFPFTFRELNTVKDKKFSLVDLIHHFFAETKEADILCSFEDFQIVFIFDGLDECRLPLNFSKNESVSEATQSTTLDVLLTNLIKGDLLPSACVWITTRPAGANQIPAECIDMVTEIRGFRDAQKEQYFRKRFKHKKQAYQIISHIKKSRTLHIMCHIPVFCWIAATVLEYMLRTSEGGELPRTLTDMYIHFLVVQAKVKKDKYHEASECHWNQETIQMIQALGKLAFEQLLKGNLIFYDSDLTECGIDMKAASTYSGVFTQIFKEERGLYQEQVFCFIHLSIQEFLAALHVHVTFTNTGLNLLSSEHSSEAKLYQSAVDAALQSPNGHFDLFLRFLMGLSLSTNQSLLQGLISPKGSSTETSQKTAEYIKQLINESVSVERSINLFHCLNELKEHSLQQQIQAYVSSGGLCSQTLSPAQWCALVFILLSSEQDLELFELHKYSASEEALFRLLPVIKMSSKAVLSVCNLTEKSCEALASVLSSQSSNLIELDLSNNDLKDEGAMVLSKGLASPHCRLETLRLSGCLLTDEGGCAIGSALNLNPSHLRTLDLSYNNIGEPGLKTVAAALENPQWRLSTVRVQPLGAHFLKPGLKKYACDVPYDENTAHRNLKISGDKMTVTRVQDKQPFPNHPNRFVSWPQVLCRTGLMGRSYWEVEWSGKVDVAVSYSGIKRRGDSGDGLFGENSLSWSLRCTDGQFSVCHNQQRHFLSQVSSGSGRIGVFVDYPAGSLSYYNILMDKLVHIYTFKTTFTDSLFPGFAFCHSDSFVSLLPEA